MRGMCSKKVVRLFGPSCSDEPRSPNGSFVELALTGRLFRSGQTCLTVCVQLRPDDSFMFDVQSLPRVVCFVLVKSPLSLSGHEIGQPGSGFHTHSEPRRARCVLVVFWGGVGGHLQTGRVVCAHLIVRSLGKGVGAPLPTRHMFSWFHVYKRAQGALKLESTVVRTSECIMSCQSA